MMRIFPAMVRNRLRKAPCIFVLVMWCGGFCLSGSQKEKPATPPYPCSGVVAGIEIDWSTHQRMAQGSDNWQLTWAADDNLYGAWGDGGGLGGTNQAGRVPLGVGRIGGNTDHLEGFNVWGGYNPENPATFKGKSWGMFALGSDLYMWVVPDVPEGMSYRNHYEYAELATSSDYAATWSLLNFQFRSEENLTIPTFLNYGKAGSGAPDRFGDYVYSFFIRPTDPEMEQMGPNGWDLVVHKPGAVYLARTPISRFPPSKDAFQFFTGFDRAGDPTWGSLENKVPVFEDPNGTGWCLSASYHPGYDRILLATEHTSSSKGLIGIFEAANPWGPWRTVAYHDEEHPFGHVRPGSALSWANNVFFLSFPTKWFNDDRFTLTFTGAGRGKDNDSLNIVSGRFLPVKNVCSEGISTTGILLHKYPKLNPKPFGKGIFAHIRAGGKIRGSESEIRKLAENPWIAGTQLSYCWSELEPARGDYRWDIIENDMEIWAQNGKKCWLEISTAFRWDQSGRLGVPDWVYQSGVPKIQAAGSAPYPVYWDTRYLQLWGEFIRAYANKFDGDPRVEWVAVGGHTTGTEPRLSSKENELVMDQWVQAGFDGFTPEGIYLKKAILPIYRMFHDAFPNTQVSSTFIVTGDFSEVMNRYAADLGFLLTSNGFGTKATRQANREMLRLRREHWGAKIGYAEFGPSGRDSRFLDEDFQLPKGVSVKDIRDDKHIAKLMDIYRKAIGDDQDPELQPYSRLSYLPLSERTASVETEEEWNAALQWAVEHLEK